MKKRLFIALNLPSNVRNMLGGVIAPLQEKNRHIRVKWVETENIHLTLHFLGGVDSDRVGEVEKILEIGCKNILPLQVELGELGGFPNSARPKVIWVELKEGRGNLVKLHEQLRKGLTNAGFEADMRLFKPHVTLGRVKVPQVFKGLDGSIEDCKFEVGSIELMESKLGPKGPSYTILKSGVLSAKQ